MSSFYYFRTKMLRKIDLIEKSLEIFKLLPADSLFAWKPWYVARTDFWVWHAWVNPSVIFQPRYRVTLRHRDIQWYWMVLIPWYYCYDINYCNDIIAMILLQWYYCDDIIAMILLRWYYCDDIIAMIKLRWYPCDGLTFPQFAM